MAVQRVIMPKLGAYTEDVLLAEWRVEEGAEVAAGTVVLEMETDKTTAEIEAETAGWLHRLVPVGETVPIGTEVGLVAETREEYDELVGKEGAAADADDAPDPLPPDADQGGSEGVAVVDVAGSGEPEHSPVASTAPTTGTPRSGGLLISPRARALLDRLGLTPQDARAITGSGPSGRITDRDVAAWVEGRATAPSQRSGGSGSSLTVQRTLPLRGRRGTIASRMVTSLQTAAQLTSVLEIDVKPLVELRARLNEEGATPRVGITSIVVMLLAHALREHPLLNSRVTETDVELLAEINVAVAVDTPEGLVVPVVRGANRLSLNEINLCIADLAERARDGSLTPDDMADGTFTVSNGGIHPVDITTAILNPPQTGILWIGRVRDRPVVVRDGAIAVRPTLQACLTFDHRAVDGGPAAAFLATFEALVTALPELPTEPTGEKS